MNPRPEVVLPPGFALRIDYDPESSPASLLITAYRDDAPVGQAHLDPRDVGQRLRLEVEDCRDDASPVHEPRLRLTPQRAMRAVMMEAVRTPAPAREPPRFEEPPVHHAMTALHALARDGVVEECGAPGAESRHSNNALVWLDNGTGIVLPSRDTRPALRTLVSRARLQLREEVVGEERSWSRVQRALRTVRALSGKAADLLGNPLALREADAEGWTGWASWSGWRVSWRGVHQTSGASEG